MGVLPWSHHALGDLVSAPEGKHLLKLIVPTVKIFSGSPATYKNYWGYEVELLKSIAHSLNFR